MTWEEQNELLFSFLENTINSDYVYLDVPGYFNVGDNLICMGTLELLKGLKYKMKYYSTIGNFDKSKVLPDVCIIMQGGGNFGDLYPGANWFRNYIVELFPNNRIVFMPQSITYNDTSLIEEDAKKLSWHKDLHIVARDKESYQILNKYFSSNYIYLYPDCAIGLYKELSLKQYNRNGGVLCIVRKDDEIGNINESLIQGDILDWSDILINPLYRAFYVPHKLICFINKRIKNNIIKSLGNFYLVKILYPIIKYVTSKKFLKYSKVVTTRLHGYIYASLLNIPTEVIDTRYKKISNYINTWNT